jgi:ATP-dependent Clp protease ATP-binding subunit ClpA
MTGIPVSGISRNETEKLLKMEEYLHKFVVAQDDAIKAVSAAIRRSRAGIASPKRPLGSFIFLGPTGVGKTYLAKQLAQYLFGSEDALIRVDMSDYMEKHTTSRLVGSPPGYVGYGEGGWLTEKVRRKPYCVILFDEIEKAHPDVFNILLQVLDDGRLTDSHGRVVDFKNTVIIMTSNIGSRDIIEANANDFDKMREAVIGHLREVFRPEFLNRLDDIVVFHKLEKKHIIGIVSLQTEAFAKRLAQQRIGFEISDAAKAALADEGYDPMYGARPLKRVVTRRLENPVSKMIIAGDLPEGKTLEVGYENGEFIYSTR